MRNIFILSMVWGLLYDWKPGAREAIYVSLKGKTDGYGDLPYSKGRSAQCSVTQMDGVWGMEEETHREEGLCKHMVDSLHCIAEISTTL